MGNPSKFELHYFLKDNSHSMDALVRNKCEAEVLALAYEAVEILGLDIKFDSEAFREGGLREVWQVLGNNSPQVSAIIAILALVLSRVPVMDAELVDLQKEDLKLSIEERKLAIEALQTQIKEGGVIKEVMEEAAKAVDQDNKILVRKSNFYRQLSTYKKVTHISMTPLDGNNRPVGDEQLVPRDQFRKFILSTQKLGPLIDEDATIEIVAPVLKEGRAKWKGIYKEEHISFAMNDKIFKDSVLAKQTRFTNGSGIVCVLSIHQKVDESGETIVTGYSVDTVLDQIDSGLTTETSQGQQYRFTKKQQDDQQELFLADSKF